ESSIISAFTVTPNLSRAIRPETRKRTAVGQCGLSSGIDEQVSGLALLMLTGSQKASEFVDRRAFAQSLRAQCWYG
ncbi:MAG: hypothetical protein ACREQD_00270, partial [Candidatus Binataceae bacterium]